MSRKVDIPEDLTPQFPAYAGYKAFNNLMEKAPHMEEISEAFLLNEIKINADTEYGKKHHFNQVETIEDFKRIVPISSYDDYAEAIERMVKGEKNLITSRPVVYYAKTSGSMNNPKNIPVTEQGLKDYSDTVRTICQFVYDSENRKYYGRAPNYGKQFMTSVISIDQVEDGTPRGPLSSAIYRDLKSQIEFVLPWPIELTFPEKKEMDLKYLRAFYGLKEKNITYLNAPFITALTDAFHYIDHNWEMLVDDIEKGILNSDIDIDAELREKFQTQLEPDPERAAELRKIFTEESDIPIALRFWPNLEYIGAAAGGGFSPYRQKIRKYVGDLPVHSAAYCASEGTIGVSTEYDTVKYLLQPQSTYFEFIPASEEVGQFDQTKTLNINELKEGEEYEIILTNCSGLYRYAIGDVIKVVGFIGEIPEVEFQYRKKQMINLAGEKTNEFHLTWVMEEVQKETQMSVTDFSIYADTDNLPGRYVILIEPTKQIPTSEREKFRDICNEKMGIINPSYGSKVKDELLLPMEVGFLLPETYYLYRDLQVLKGASENQLKPVRVIDTPAKESFFFALIDHEV